MTKNERIAALEQKNMELEVRIRALELSQPVPDPQKPFAVNPSYWPGYICTGCGLYITSYGHSCTGWTPNQWYNNFNTCNASVLDDLFSSMMAYTGK